MRDLTPGLVFTTDAPGEFLAEFESKDFTDAVGDNTFSFPVTETSRGDWDWLMSEEGLTSENGDFEDTGRGILLREGDIADLVLGTVKKC